MAKKISPAAKQAIMVGSLCSFSYLAIYVVRNMLGAVTPQMLESGMFTQENIGSFSSIYFIVYAIGQLINGKLGDHIKGKYMLGFGLILAGVCNYLFSTFAHSYWMCYISYGLSGFFLSMIYGPMAKIVSENTESKYTTRCILGYTFASFFGSPLAGVLAAFLAWQAVFIFGSLFLVVMGVVCFIVFSLFEKKGVIQYGKYPKATGGKMNFKVLLKHRIVTFSLFSIITGVVRTTVVFWLPTYLSQYLGFTPETSALIFTVSSFVITAAAFVSVFVYEKLGSNMARAIRVFFISAAICFLLVFLCRSAVPNIVLLILAIMSSNCVSTMIWSRYCPGLRDTGMVSSVTGYLDCISYLAAAASSTLFANAVSQIGWGNLILIWFGLMVVGLLAALRKAPSVV